MLCGFAHAQIAERLREQEALRVNPSVSCHQFLGRYFLLREILWTAYFVALGAWSALVGCALFALYPVWRRAWRKMHPIIVVRQAVWVRRRPRPRRHPHGGIRQLHHAAVLAAVARTSSTVEASVELGCTPQQAIIDYAPDAKSFIRESGEHALPDELLMRASVAFNMLQSRGMITAIRTDQGCKPHPFDVFDRAFSIALIAHNFDDHPPNTPERKVLFGAKLAAFEKFAEKNGVTLKLPEALPAKAGKARGRRGGAK